MHELISKEERKRMDNRENNAGFLVRELSNAMKKKTREYDDDHCGRRKLTMMQGWIIGYIANHTDHDIYQRELETELNIGKSTLTEVLHLMEKNDLVKRVADENDGRCKKIVMTEKSKKIDSQIMMNIQNLEDKMREGISEEEYQTFIRIIKKMIYNISTE